MVLLCRKGVASTRFKQPKSFYSAKAFFLKFILHEDNIKDGDDGYTVQLSRKMKY